LSISACNQPNPEIVRQNMVVQNSNFRITMKSGGWSNVFITDRYTAYDSYIEFTDKISNNDIILHGSFIIEKLR
jgi:hypothetical protein